MISGYPSLARFKAQLAMAVMGKNRHRHLLRVRRRHWNDTARACGSGAGAEPWIGELLARLEPAIQQVQAALPPGFPDNVSEPIFSGMRAAAARLAAMPPDA